MTIPEEFLTIIEFAKKVHLHPNSVRRLIIRGRIQAINMGTEKKKFYRISVSEIGRIARFDLRDMLKKIRDEDLNSKNDSD
jgi:hypothetical protein